MRYSAIGDEELHTLTGRFLEAASSGSKTSRFEGALHEMAHCLDATGAIYDGTGSQIAKHMEHFTPVRADISEVRASAVTRAVFVQLRIDPPDEILSNLLTNIRTFNKGTALRMYSRMSGSRKTTTMARLLIKDLVETGAIRGIEDT